MRKTSLLSIAALCLSLLFASSSPAAAGDPAGWWTSSTGAQVHIWANMQQVQVTVVGSDGQQHKYNGAWTRFSDYFQYQIPGSGTYQAAFDPGNSNRIYVKSPDGRQFVWTRGRSAAAAQPQAAPARINLSGTWRSSSGSTVQVTVRGNQISLQIITTKGDRFQGDGRWLDNSRFDYSVVGFDGVAYGTVINGRQVQVNYQGQITTWSR